MVTGAGRSGTSTIAGSLHHLGLKSPEPSLKTNDSNPRGFFEPQWSVNFHNQILNRAMVDLTDGRPYARELVADAVTRADRERLQEWLHDQTDGVFQTVVKDPRSIWALNLWAGVADDLDLRTGYLAMLRHPTAVHASRATHYPARRDRVGPQNFVATNLTGWINANLLSERITRGKQRLFVSYDALLSDWRTTMRTVEDVLDLRFDADLTVGEPHVIDSFIDPTLQRSPASWEGLDVPPRLRDIAEEVWDACNALGGTVPDVSVHRRLDDVGQAYVEYFQECEAVARYAHLAAATGARREAEQKAAAERTAQVEPNVTTRPRVRLRRRLGRLRRAISRRLRADSTS